MFWFNRVSGMRDFRCADLRGFDLVRQDLTGFNLEGADLRGTRLAGARLHGANLSQCKTGSRLRGRLARMLATLSVVALSGMLQCVPAVFFVEISYGSHRNRFGWLAVTAFLVTVLISVVSVVRYGLSLNCLVRLVAIIFPYMLAAMFFDFAIFTSGDLALFGGVFSGILAIIFAGTGLVISSSSALSAVATISAGVITVGCAVTVTKTGVATSPVAFAYATGLAIVATYLQRRAMRGDTRETWLRHRILWFERLAQTDLSHADLTDANLTGVDLRGVDLDGATLLRTRLAGAHGLERARFTHTELHAQPLRQLAATLDGNGQDFSGQRLAAVALRGATLEGSSLIGCDFTEAELSQANLRRADLRETRLNGACLRGAQLSRARLEHADLRGADLTDAILDDAQVMGARIDLKTFEHSHWSAGYLASLRAKGVRIDGLDGFPVEVLTRLLLVREGLTLYFRTRLDRLDRVLIEGTIVGVLGRETDCDIADFRSTMEGAVVRLTATKREDLELVAEAFYRKVWEVEQEQARDGACHNVQAQEQALVRMLDWLQSPHLRDKLTGLRERLSVMEMNDPEAAAVTRVVLTLANRERALVGPMDAGELRWRLLLDEGAGNRYELGRPRRLLIHHATEDDPWAVELRKHLTPLVHEKLAVVAGPLLPGVVIDEEQRRLICEADVLLVLISSDYLASDDCMALLRLAVQRPSGKLVVVPVLVREVSIDGTLLAGRKALPENARAVMTWPSRDAAWKNVADGLRLLLRSSL